MLIATELAVLKIAMGRPDLAHLLFLNLDDSHIRGESARTIFRAMRELRESGTDVSMPTVRDAVRGAVPDWLWPEMLKTTVGVYPAGEERFLLSKIQLLKDQYACREILADVERAAKAPVIQDESRAHIVELAKSMTLIGTEREETGIKAALEEYANFAQGGEKIALGFPTLDRLIGGIALGEVTTIMARTAVGKTFMALNLLLRLAGSLPHKIAFFSLEMAKPAIMQRLIEIYFGVSRAEADDKILSGDPMLRELEERFARVDFLAKTYSASEIARTVEKGQHKIVFVDFLGLVRPEVGASPYQEISQIIRDLKQMAKDQECACFLTQQVSRKGESGWTPIDMSMARDSGQVEELSDFILGMWAPGQHPDAKTEERGTLQVHLLKNKRGEQRIITCRLDSRCGRIYEVEAEAEGED